ncbi:unnamed protein product [Chironomus riparius]|uniref:Mediator of RNA polymerase II transcription subunit 29 n=1 Tax=Chironomus riparius TaxID=315576 RepID=A0A9N9RWE9_9DIPT|nr:unnamed protein product [Chironomus riparius]
MNQPVRLQQSSVANTSQIIQDNITKAKHLMISLNLSLSNLFEAARSEINNEERNPDQKSYFEKYFEEFCSIIDQIELNLITALKCIQQADNSRKYLPLPVNVNPQPNSWNYNQYLNVAKAQIKHLEEVRSTFSLNE